MRILRALLLAIPVVTFAGCFNYDEPACSFKCGGGIECPEDYECHTDGYCHQLGSTEICPFSDAATPLDFSANIVDLTMLGDGGEAD